MPLPPPPMSLRPTSALAAILAAMLALPAMGQDFDFAPPPDGRQGNGLAVFTTLPLAFGEARDLTAILDGTAEPHWARAVIEGEWGYTPLDTLDAEDLTGRKRLLLAQPRALSGRENVALDDWVRGGGSLLMFADPLMTGHSAFGIGDRRRPQDVALLSPILARWGLELAFDGDQDARMQFIGWDGLLLPAALRGELRHREPAGGVMADCEIGAEALVARCRIGAGRVLVVADAALLDADPAAAEPMEAALMGLMERAFRPD